MSSSSQLKRKQIDSSSSSSQRSIDWTTWKEKKRRTRRRWGHSRKELKEEMTQIRSSMEDFQKKVTEEIKELKNAILRTCDDLKELKEEMTRICFSTEDFQKKFSEEFKELKNAILRTRYRPFPLSSQNANIRNLKLQCKTRLDQRVFTGNKLVGDQGTGIEIILIDADTNRVITTGIESSIKVRAVVLEGDFDREDHENWPREEFDSNIVKERPQKRPLLIGELQVTLKDGVGSLNNLTFTDNSRWTRSKMFRIGVQAASGYCEGTRIREALTEPFSVLEHRGESCMKHHPPESSDQVWRLECIRKDGPFHKRLNEERICNVEEFLQAYNRDKKALRNILGSGMTTKKWNSLINHAKTCPPNGKYYVYRDAERNYDLLFNNFAYFAGLVLNGVLQPINSMSDNEKQVVDAWVKIAHQNWKDVTEYAGLRGLDPVIERSIIFRPAAAVLPGNHYGIPSDLTSLPDGNAGSSVAAEKASTLQQMPAQAGETPKPCPLVQSTPPSSNHSASCSYNSDEFNFEELLNELSGA